MLRKAPALQSVCIDREEQKVSDFILELTSAHPTIAAEIVNYDELLWSRHAGRNGGAISPATRTCTLAVGDALSLLANFPWSGGEFVYCDPPYLHETRTSRHRYLFEMEPVEHQALLEILKTIPAPVMVSGYHSELYAGALAKWRVVTFDAITRGGTMRKEHLWCNFPEPVELHDYRYLGSNFRERQNLNRMRKRWQARLKNMPLLKRRALLAALREGV